MVERDIAQTQSSAYFGQRLGVRAVDDVRLRGQEFVNALRRTQRARIHARDPTEGDDGPEDLEGQVDEHEHIASGQVAVDHRPTA